MNLADRRWLRLFTLCVLYVAQGIPWGFTATTIPAYLAERGLSREAIGIALAMTTLPYAFKWVWGPIIDAFTIPRFGRRRPWIVVAQLMMALTLGSLIAIPDLTADLRLLAWVILIHTVFNALQDVAVDALAIDLLDAAERGRANGLMYASKYGGGIIGGFGMSKLIAWASLSTALVAQTVILLAIMLVPLLVRERATGAASPRPALGDVLRSLAEVFAVRSAFVTALLVLGLNVGLGVLSANGFTLFTTRLGWTHDEYTSLTGGLGLAAGLGGAIIGGLLADVVGHRRLVGLASIAMAAGWVAFGVGEAAWSRDGFVYALAIVEALAQAIMTVSLFALCMDVAWSPTAASQFTAYMALSNFSTTLGYRLAAALGGWVDFQGAYFVAAAIQVVVTGLLLLIDPGQIRRALPRPAGVAIRPASIIAVGALALALVGITVYAVRGTF